MTAGAASTGTAAASSPGSSSATARAKAKGRDHLANFSTVAVGTLDFGLGGDQLLKLVAAGFAFEFKQWHDAFPPMSAVLQPMGLVRLENSNHILIVEASGVGFVGIHVEV